MGSGKQTLNGPLRHNGPEMSPRTNLGPCLDQTLTALPGGQIVSRKPAPCPLDTTASGMTRDMLLRGPLRVVFDATRDGQSLRPTRHTLPLCCGKMTTQNPQDIALAVECWLSYKWWGSCTLLRAASHRLFIHTLVRKRRLAHALSFAAYQSFGPVHSNRRRSPSEAILMCEAQTHLSAQLLRA
ncbi:hypothetical protein NUW58_g8714 [Xylaria curta]|uniref:Uncharacterized protein n=1 Tax=Xylaria curta TaxID=42375 RepID=A0ACC1N4Q4_9PEZI|nr:hypothetical protein NUW58_g8714 [Xylaria curta]